MPTISAYGSWSSPVTAASAAAAGGGPQWLGSAGNELWWAEARPAEDGRVALMRSLPDGGAEEVLPAPWNVRNRLHEYGGRPWTFAHGVAVFTHWADQRVHIRRADGEVVPLTPMPASAHAVRYGDLQPGRAGEVWAVRERVTGPRPTDVEREQVAIALDGSGERVLAASHHFLTAPQLSPDGAHAAWFGWDHPAMPWDGTALCVAPIAADGSFGPARVVAGGAEVAVCQFAWETPDTLLALLDPDGWWNLHRVGLDGTVTNLAPMTEEVGGPLWKTGSQWFTPLGGGRHALLAGERLAVLDEHAGTVTPLAPELTSWSWSGLCAYRGGIAGVAAGPRRASAVVHVSGDSWTALTPQPGGLPGPEYLPEPEFRTFPASDGTPVPAHVYRPANPDFAGPDGELPPFVVIAHGGPTDRHDAGLDLDIAFFTSRGIGVVAVDYAGSSGYGRAYRERLREQWGVADVADCVTVAEALVAAGIADGERLAVRGGSAGGFTAVASLTTTKTYRAGTVKYPLLDLLGWTAETHDFESRYLDGLVGPLPAARRRYLDRSPSAPTAAPVLFLQGEEDQVCPRVQADRFVAGLTGCGVDHAYLTFPGEQHGFRRADTMIAVLEAELSFYGQVFGFATPDVPHLELSR